MASIPSAEYVIHGIPRSLFTRKLEAAFAFYGLPYRSASRGTGGGDELGQRAGTHQIPILVTPENWALADTTPILGLLDARHPARRLFPTGAAGVLVHVLEEIVDEWVSRVMVHYRWHYPENTAWVIEQFTGQKLGLDEVMQHPVAQWGPRACRATGTESEHQRKTAEDEYLGLMTALEAQLASTPFALGGRPTALDTILIGGLHAHTHADPIPDLTGYTRVIAWAEGGAFKAGDGEWGELPSFPECTPFAEHLLALGRDQYVAFVEGNASALRDGAKSFEIETYGEVTSYLARPYPEQSRRMLQDRIANALSEAERKAVTSWLGDVGLECFLP